MRLIDRLLLGRLILRTAAFFLLSALIVMTTQVLGEIFRIVESSGGLAVAFRLFSIVFPMITVSVLPIAFLFAMLITYGAMEQDRETGVLMASGVGPSAFLRPAAWLAGSIALLVLIFSLFVEPPANRALREMLEGLHYNALRLIVADGALREVAPDVFAHAGSAARDGEVGGVFILDRRDRVQQMLFLARGGQIAQDGQSMQLGLDEGLILLDDPSRVAPHSVRFGRFTGDAGGFFPAAGQTLGPVQATTVELFAMLGAASSARTAPGAIRSELSRRLTDWIWPLVFFSVAAWAVVGNGVSRTARRWSLPGAVVIAGASRIVGVVVVNNAAASQAAAVAAFALPIGLVAMFLLLARRRAGRVGRAWRMPFAGGRA